MSSPLRFTPPPPTRHPHASTRLVVVSGLSGSGKTVALRTLEDLDYYCVDNLPVELMPAFVEAVTEGQPGRYPRLAVGVEARTEVQLRLHAPDVPAEARDHRLLAFSREAELEPVDRLRSLSPRDGTAGRDRERSGDRRESELRPHARRHRRGW